MKISRTLCCILCVLLMIFSQIIVVNAEINKEQQDENLLSVSQLDEWGILYYITDSTASLNTSESTEIHINTDDIINTLTNDYEPGHPLRSEDLTTTGGLAVTGVINYDWDSTSKKEQIHIDEIVNKGFTDLIVQDLPTHSYNDLAYAWYGSTEYWITPISFNSFYNDPHCDEIDLENVSVGDIVTYWSVWELDNGGYIYSDCLHSGKVEAINSDGIMVESKWDSYGRYIHALTNVLNDYKQELKDGRLAIFPRFFRYTQGEHLSTYTSIDDDQHLDYCEQCQRSEYTDHEIRSMTVSSTRHRNICYDCGYSAYESHTPEYTEYSDEEHKVRCSGCGYTVFEGHDLYVSDTYNDVYTIECRGCSYSISCNCDREYVPDGSAGHYIDCIEGCFSEFESHTYELTGEYDNYGHEIECIYCGYSDYIDHDLYMYFEDVGEYVVKCRDCTYTVECWEEPEYYGDSEDGHWVDCPCGCYSFFEPHSPGNYYNTEEGYHEIECADCGYLYTEDCSYGSSATSGNSYYHFYECTYCGYERAEAHVFTYSQIANNIYSHNAYCRICKATHTKFHNWVSVSGGYRCSDCRMPTSIIPDYSSLSDEELSLLLSSMSEEELEQFIASLPEDALARVTATLPPDDDDEVSTK